MAIETSYVLSISMDVQADKEDLFNEVYDTEHVPALLKVEGVRAVWRGKAEDHQFAVGGGIVDKSVGEDPCYVAYYEVDSPEVIKSDAWGIAVEEGRWPSEVRPYTSNRRHLLHKKVD